MGKTGVDRTHPIFENLSTDEFESADGFEVMTSDIELPGRTQIRKRTHAGEEFAYVIDGSVYLLEEGKAETLCLPASRERSRWGRFTPEMRA